ncbi:hypothetical protein MASR1M107_19330 [Ignavibacteriales bacterium]
MANNLVKTEAIVLSRIKFSDSSNIISFYTRTSGKISGLVKGARNIKSKSGLATDVLNLVELFYYEKEGRELYTINSAELIFHPKEVMTDLDSISCATSVIELLKELTPLHEENDRLFRGTEKIIRLLDKKKESPLLLLLRYFLFILDESGVGIHTQNCATCGIEIDSKTGVRFDPGFGILCEKCSSEKRRGISISMELYSLLSCLNSGKSVEVFDENVIKKLINLLETYTRTHFETFKGLKALRIIGDL